MGVTILCERHYFDYESQLLRAWKQKKKKKRQAK